MPKAHRDRPTIRFPPSLESKVYQEAIRDRLYQLDARLEYASAATVSELQ